MEDNPLVLDMEKLENKIDKLSNDVQRLQLTIEQLSSKLEQHIAFIDNTYEGLRNPTSFQTFILKMTINKDNKTFCMATDTLACVSRQYLSSMTHMHCTIGNARTSLLYDIWNNDSCVN